MRTKISFTMIRNEADIIESFVRYNMNFLNYMAFIYDNSCTDGTLKILNNLIKEGYPVLLFDEKGTVYEEYVIKNKYMHLLLEEYHPDILVPLDADEFIIGKERNPNEILENLPLDKVYYINWRTYVLTGNENNEEPFIPARFQYARCDEIEEEGFTKVIIPGSLVRARNIIIETGHHSVTGDQDLQTEKITSLKLAHIPVISKEKLESKIYGNVMNNINWKGRGDGEGYHQNVLYRKMRESGINLKEYSLYYGLDESLRNKFHPNTDVKYLPIALSDCKNTVIKYKELSQIDILENLLQQLNILELKYYELERKMKASPNAIPILVYGTGAAARNLFHGLDQERFEICAYINSDLSYNGLRFQGRIVIAPDYIKCFQYDKIIIASKAFYDEIYGILKEKGIPEEKIGDKTCLLTYCI